MGDTSILDKKTIGENGEALWARLAGFPLWPARRCSKFEEKKLKQPTEKQIAVIFLGKRCESGLVQDNSVSCFNASTMKEKFLPKKFKTDKDYRAALVEATRIAIQSGEIFDQAYMEMIDSCKQDFPLTLPESQLCTECRGSSLSGQLMSCQGCEGRKRHWHCFSKMEEGAWMCDTCCKNDGVPVGTLVPFLPDSDQSAELLQPTGVRAVHQNTAVASGLSLSDPKHISFNQPGGGTSVAATINRSNTKKTQSSSLNNNNNNNISAEKGRNSLIAQVTSALTTTPTPSAGKGLNGQTERANLVEDQMRNEGDANGTDEQCFVCGMGGHLLLCDYPNCVRAYHQVCVMQICPDSVDSLTDGDAALFGFPAAASLAEPWFCPCHHCVGCHALQCTTTTLAATDIPSALYTQQQQVATQLSISNNINATSNINNNKNSSRNNNSNSNTTNGHVSSREKGQIKQKILTNCDRCPFAVCSDCETALGSKKGLFEMKRFAEIKKCLNCSSKNPKLKLAKILEKAWVKSADSRLAVPFLRPFLPIAATVEEISTLEGGGGSDHNEEHVKTAVGRKRKSSGKSELVDTNNNSSSSSSSSKVAKLAVDISDTTNKDNSNNHSSSINGNSCNSANGQCKDTCRPADLLGVLEKIRALQYASCQQYCADLAFLRTQLSERVDAKSVNPHSQDTTVTTTTSSSSATTTTKNRKCVSSSSILMSFDTVAEASYALLTTHLLATQALELQILEETKQCTTGIGAAQGSNHIADDMISETPLSREKCMERLWRIECVHPVPSSVLPQLLYTQNHHSSNNNSNNNSDHHQQQQQQHIEFRIPERSLASWCAFLEDGKFPQHFRGSQDPYSMERVISANEHLHEELPLAQRRVRGMLYGCGDPEFPKYMESEVSAAQLMLGMSSTAVRDRLTLLEGAPSVVETSSRHAGYYRADVGESGLVQDDTLLVMDRLREVTQKALQLEQRLRQDYIAKQQSLLDTDTEVITIGKASVITELKLANDNLRWRLQQKQNLINSQQIIINNLKKQLVDSQKGLAIPMKYDDNEF